MSKGLKCGNTLVQIAITICVFSVAIVVVFAILAKDQIIASAYIIGVLAAMGLGLGWLSTRVKTDEDKEEESEQAENVA